MYAAIFLTGLLGFSLNKVFVVIGNRVIHWAGK
jgi:ABC-type nitrate/sulfonate/bicarbonate transport system permease component